VKRAVVIGSGFGGLALAIRLQSAGIGTTVIEGRDKPGGRAYYWEKDGFTFDAGPTVRPIDGRRYRTDAGQTVLPAQLA
jgi:phytoene desaturase